MSSEYNAGAAASFKLEKAWSKLDLPASQMALRNNCFLLHTDFLISEPAFVSCSPWCQRHMMKMICKPKPSEKGTDISRFLILLMA